MWDSGSEVGISFDLDAQHSSSSSSSSSSSFLSGLFSTAPSVSSLSELAYIVENNVILSAINAQLAASDVKVRHHSKVLKYLLPSSQHSSPHYPTVVLEGGQQLSTKLLVLACCPSFIPSSISFSCIPHSPIHHLSMHPSSIHPPFVHAFQLPPTRR